MQATEVRAIYRAAKVADREAPYNSIAMKLYYPSASKASFEEQQTGFLPPDSSLAPFPVVIILPGANIANEAYGWLARRFAKAGFAAVTYSWVTLDMGDQVSASPGILLDRLTPETCGQAPSCPALPAILDELSRMQSDGILAGHLDLEHVLFGGHSLGGSMALLNANTGWHPNVCGAFAYATHTAGNLYAGWQPGSFMPVAEDLPLLMMGGNRDGVIPATNYLYQDEKGDRLERSFREGIAGGRGDRHLVIVDGAGHYSFAHPHDKATARAYLDQPTPGGGKRIRRYLGELIVSFCRQACHADVDSAAALQALCSPEHPLVAVAQSK